MEEPKRRTEEDEDGVDRISELPEPILHHILYFLPQMKAVKTCVLSKSWRYLWCARPKIDFRQNNSFLSRLPVNEDCFFKGNTQTFLAALNKTLQAYHDQKLHLQDFIVSMAELDSNSVLFLQKWIPIVLFSMRVKKFHLGFAHTSPHFDLPSLVFEADELLELYLKRCIINDNLIVVKLKNLQTLMLSGVHIAEQIFYKIISSCPLILFISLTNCEGFEYIKLSHNNVKRFDFTKDINSNDVAARVEICAPTIKYLNISRGCFLLPNNLCLSNLISINFFDSRLPSLFSCNLPCLQYLFMRSCEGVEEFNLLTRRPLKQLSIVFHTRPLKATIDAPSIIKFTYTGKIPQSISFSTTGTEHSESNIILFCSGEDFDNNASVWVDKLNELLKALSGSKINLVLQDIKRSISNRQLNIESGPFGTEENQVLEFVCKILLKEIREGNHFWHLGLEEVRLYVFDEVVKNWRPVESMVSLLKCGGAKEDGALDFQFTLKGRSNI